MAKTKQNASNSDMTTSLIRSHLSGRLLQARGPMSLRSDARVAWDTLERVGLQVREMERYSSAMDGQIVGPASGGGGEVPRGFLETWLPGVIRTVSNVTSIDRVLGITTVGRWEDDYINIRMSEPVGKAEPYSDEGNIPLASYKGDVASRRVQRFEEGFQTGILSQIRQNHIGVQEATEKRRAVAAALDASRNHVGWHGSGTGTYGLLNDPSLPTPILTTGHLWGSAKTFADATADFTRLVEAIEAQMGRNIDENQALTFAIPTGYRSVLSLTPDSDSKLTFSSWIKREFPNTRIVAASELQGVTTAGFTNRDMFYLFLDSVQEEESDGAITSAIIQAVPARYRVLGSEQRIKGYVEAATCATAGVIVTRPYAVARMVNQVT